MDRLELVWIFIVLSGVCITAGALLLGGRALVSAGTIGVLLIVFGAILGFRRHSHR